MRADELLLAKRQSALGLDRAERQHRKGKLTARERIDLLFDRDTFQELSILSCPEKSLPGDGVITGFGKINGQTVYCSADDFTVLGGSVGRTHAEKKCRVMDLAYSSRCPYISLNDSGGARIDEGIVGLNGYGEIFRRNVKLSGVVPQIAVILGPSAGGACYSPALMDAVFMCKEHSLMFITGPDVTKAVIFEENTDEELGGWLLHSTESSVASYAYETEEECLESVRRFLSYLQIRKTDSSESETLSEVSNIVPENGRKTYDMTRLLSAIFDNDSLFLQKELFAPNVITALARIGGRSVGIVANQPEQLSGALDYKASIKIARFVQFCDAFSLPVITFVDVPAFMPGRNQERSGIIRHGAQVLFAYAQASVPLITIILRKAYGGAYIAMGSKSLGADFCYAWPTAEIAVMGADGAVRVLHKRELDKLSAEEIKALEEEYREKYSSPYEAERALLVDEVILPEETRDRIVGALDALKNKVHCSENHRNIPL